MMANTLPALAAGALLLSACTPTGPTPLTGPFPTSVDCAAGQSINAAIAAGYTQITFRGTCNEEVRIEVDGITLIGDPAGATIASTAGSGASLTIDGAQNTSLHGFTVDGSGTANHAIAMRHADAIMQDLEVTGGKAAGIYVSTNSSANVQGSLLQGNRTAMTVINNSFANVTGTLITKTDFVGVISSRTSTVNFGGESRVDGVENGVGISVAAGGHLTLREGASVAGVNGNGVEVDGGSLTSAESSITGNSGYGIRAENAASVFLDRTTVSGNGANGIWVRTGSGGEFIRSTITGNGAVPPVRVDAGSVFSDSGGSTVTP